MRKAFDTINKDLLSHKLSIRGFRGNVNAFLTSYLTNRKQYVDVDGYVSEVGSVNCGVPQGSVLGPLLFNIFINDIVNVGNAKVKKILFADDAVFYIKANSLQECMDEMRLFIAQLSDWLENNKLIPTVEKTKLMMFTPRPIYNLPDIYFSGTKLEWVHSIRYLGMLIDDKLNFALHTSEVAKKLSKLQGFFYSLSPLVPRCTLLTLYHSLVYPVIIQNVIIWGGVPESNLKDIKIAINKILRSITKVRCDHNNIPLVSTNEMYKSVSLMKFDDVYRFFLLKFVQNVFYRNTDLFQEFYAPLLPSHSYGTRGVRINLPSVRVEVEKRFAIFQSCRLINELPEEFMEPQSHGSLKVKYRTFVLSGY